MNKLFVKLVAALAPLWRRLGGDPEAIRLILAAKLKMDDRGGYLMGQRQAPKSGMEMLVFFFMFIFGAASIVTFFFCEHDGTSVGLIFSFWLVYIGLLLVTELSNNLFDTRDLYILLSRPITEVTLTLSRMLHIGVFTAKFALSMGLPVFVFLLFWRGVVAALAFFLTSVITGVIIITFTLAAYLLLIRLAPPGKVRKWVGYFQIFASTFFFLLYQLPNLFSDQFDDSGSESIMAIVGTPWGYVFPGLWVGGTYGLLTGEWQTPHLWGQGLLALGAATAGLIFYVRQSKGYGSQLLNMRMTGSGEKDEAAASANRSPSRFSPRSWLGRAFTRPNLERASLNFHWRIMQRDINYKQRTYPSMVIVPVIMAVMLFRTFSDVGGGSLFSDESTQLMILLYMLILVVIMPQVTTKISESYQASWIFLARPLERKGQLRYGQLLAVWGMFFVPTALLAYGIILAFWGWSVLPDIALSAAAVLFLSIVLGEFDKSTLPFSESKDGGGFNSFGPLLLTFLIAPVIGVLHYFLAKLPYLVSIGAVVAWVVVLFMLRQLRREKE